MVRYAGQIDFACCGCFMRFGCRRLFCAWRNLIVWLNSQS